MLIITKPIIGLLLMAAATFGETDQGLAPFHAAQAAFDEAIVSFANVDQDHCYTNTGAAKLDIEELKSKFESYRMALLKVNRAALPGGAKKDLKKGFKAKQKVFAAAKRSLRTKKRAAKLGGKRCFWTRNPTPPPTQPPTEPPTPPPTEEPTPGPTPAPTPAPTEEPTPAPTQPPTEPPTPPPTQPPTEPPTPAPTQPPTEPPTPAPTQPPTEPLTPAPTQPLTPAPTQPLTPAPTQPLTEPPTQEGMFGGILGSSNGAPAGMYTFLVVRTSSTSGSYTDIMKAECTKVGMKPVCDHPTYCENDQAALYIGQKYHVAHKPHRDNIELWAMSGWSTLKDKFPSSFCTFTGAYGSNEKSLCTVGSSHGWNTPAENGDILCGKVAI